MNNLIITITQQTNIDFDGINETVKHVTATINLVDIPELYTCDLNITDAIVKTSFKQMLTDNGYIWDTES